MNNQMHVRLNESNTTPGATLTGNAHWDLAKEPRNVAIRLFWHTRGRGTEDVEVVEEIVIDEPRTQQSCDFNFQLPIQPYSFNGNLISIEWGVEVTGGKESDMATFTMGPDGRACQGGSPYDDYDDGDFDADQGAEREEAYEPPEIRIGDYASQDNPSGND